MNETERHNLRQNQVDLVNNLEPTDILDFLLEDGILTENDCELISVSKTRRERAQLLLAMLPTRGPTAYGSFQRALHQGKYEFLGEKLSIGNTTDLKSKQQHRVKEARNVSEVRTCMEIVSTCKDGKLQTILKDHIFLLLDNVEPKDLIDHFYQEQILNDSNVELIKSGKTRKERGLLFLHFISQGHIGNVADILLRSLHRKFKYIGDVIIRSLKPENNREKHNENIIEKSPCLDLNTQNLQSTRLACENSEVSTETYPKEDSNMELSLMTMKQLTNGTTDPLKENEYNGNNETVLKQSEQSMMENSTSCQLKTREKHEPFSLKFSDILSNHHRSPVEHTASSFPARTNCLTQGKITRSTDFSNDTVPKFSDQGQQLHLTKLCQSKPTRLTMSSPAYKQQEGYTDLNQNSIYDTTTEKETKYSADLLTETPLKVMDNGETLLHKTNETMSMQFVNIVSDQHRSPVQYTASTFDDRTQHLTSNTNDQFDKVSPEMSDERKLTQKEVSEHDQHNFKLSRGVFDHPRSPVEQSVSSSFESQFLSASQMDHSSYKKDINVNFQDDVIQKADDSDSVYNDEADSAWSVFPRPPIINVELPVEGSKMERPLLMRLASTDSESEVVASKKNRRKIKGNKRHTEKYHQNCCNDIYSNPSDFKKESQKPEMTGFHTFLTEKSDLQERASNRGETLHAKNTESSQVHIELQNRGDICHPLMCHHPVDRNTNLSGRHLIVTFNYLSTLINQGNFDKFEQFSSGLQRKYFKDPDMKCLLGYLHASRDLFKTDFDSAKKHIDKAFEIVPKTSNPKYFTLELFTTKTRMYISQKKLEKLQNALDDAKMIIETDPLGCSGRAAGWLYMNDARNCTAQIGLLNFRNPNAFTSYSKLHKRAKESFQKALANFQRDGGKDGPFGFGYALCRLAILLLRCGDNGLTMDVLIPPEDDIKLAGVHLQTLEDSEIAIPKILEMHFVLAKCDYQFRRKNTTRALEYAELAYKVSSELKLLEFTEHAHNRCIFLRTKTPLVIDDISKDEFTSFLFGDHTDSHTD